MVWAITAFTVAPLMVLKASIARVGTATAVAVTNSFEISLLR